MSSGHGIAGGVGRCYPFFAEFKECLVSGRCCEFCDVRVLLWCVSLPVIYSQGDYLVHGAAVNSWIVCCSRLCRFSFLFMIVQVGITNSASIHIYNMFYSQFYYRKPRLLLHRKMVLKDGKIIAGKYARITLSAYMPRRNGPWWGGLPMKKNVKLKLLQMDNREGGNG